MNNYYELILSSILEREEIRAYQEEQVELALLDMTETYLVPSSDESNQD